MASSEDAGDFSASLGCLSAPALDGLATQLSAVAGISVHEREAILSATVELLDRVLHAKLSRVLVLELNAARELDLLGEGDSAQRWRRFIEISSRHEFWQQLQTHYPTLLSRIERVVENRCVASLRLAERWAEDRPLLDSLCAGGLGGLLELEFGAGDSHCNGQTVAILRCDNGRVVYKPRSLAVDDALQRFVASIEARHPHLLSVRVPNSIDRGTHGWSEYVDHRYAADESELRSFYRGIGQWLAIMRLLGGSDLHAENVIAHGGVPVVIDCETLFTPRIPPKRSGLGEGPDRAAALIAGTVLTIGLLPGRGIGLGWRGVDSSATGMLPGQQPMLPLPSLVEVGSDRVRIGTRMVAATPARNHPSSEPMLSRYWPHVLEGFEEAGKTLLCMEQSQTLGPAIEVFAECTVRVVPRATEVYAEMGRMLWHPISLHDEGKARLRAHDLLAKMAANVAAAPDDPAVIDAEIEDLLDGDVPYFCTTPQYGRLQGPRGTQWLPESNLLDEAWREWKQADFDLERRVIRASLVSAYINDGWMPEEETLLPKQARDGDLDSRRRRQAAAIIGTLIGQSIPGNDGSVAWIAPVLGQNGWLVQPLGPDLYNGTSGIALVAGAYLREMAVGRADPVDGVEDLFLRTLRTLALAEEKRAEQRQRQAKMRPLAPGGYIGLGSQIWTYLALASLGLDQGQGVQRARDLAEELPWAVEADEAHDLLSGSAGAIVPLIALYRATGDGGYLVLADRLADRLRGHADIEEGRMFWRHSQWPDGVGGFAHGSTGIGWALALLARETGQERHLATARSAFAFEDALFDEQERNWLDLRKLAGARTAAAWCHGAVGIGLAAFDLDPAGEQSRTRSILRAAAAATWRIGLGWNHCACHGDTSALELLQHAIALREGPPGLSREDLLSLLLTSLEEHGPCCGVLRETFAPGLMPGATGIVYQLLRSHPDSDLPSILTPARIAV